MEDEKFFLLYLEYFITVNRDDGRRVSRNHVGELIAEVAHIKGIFNGRLEWCRHVPFG